MNSASLTPKNGADVGDGSLPLGAILGICFGVIVLLGIGVVLVLRRSRHSFREYTVSSHVDSAQDETLVELDAIPATARQTEIQTYSEVLTFADDQNARFGIDEADGGIPASALW